MFFGQIFDPLTQQNTGTPNECRSPFPNNQIPLNRLSTVAQNVLKLIPEPNFTGTGVNYIQDTADTITQTVYSIRLDENLGAKQKIWGFWSSRENSDQGNCFNLPPPINSCCAVGDRFWQTVARRLGLDVHSHSNQRTDIWHQPLEQLQPS